MSEGAIQAAVQVSESRLWDRLMELGRIGALPDGGVCRHALSAEDVEARTLLIDLAARHGFSVSTDRAANLWIRREGSDTTAEAVVSGSHLDTQPAGTIPFSLRRDAFQAMTRAVAALNELMDDPTGATRFTIGRIVVEPNSASTIPGSVSFSIDFRHPDGRVLDGKGGKIHTIIDEAAAPCDVDVELQSLAPPATFSESILNIIEASSDAIGLRHRRLPSGAFHDAWHVAKACPTGMIFIPCRNGISHHPDEWASPVDCANGARVLAAALVELANE